ncbi:MAG: orotate phosphoribosyltransferase [Candidatus Altiarchaeota archaeon]|nr:orotate phosphoribosyltransferase [Candidatus Altiarchaeota archaeon]
MDDERTRLLELVKESALSIGEITLSSGKKSSYYIDCRRVTLDPEGAYLVAKILLDMFHKEGIDAVGGLTLGADPILGALAAVSFLEGKPIPTFIVRKTSKKHGTKKTIEGCLKEGSQVAVVDDVATTGNSLMQVIDVVENRDCEVKKVVVIVDREEGAKKTIAGCGYALESIFSRRELGV